MGIIINKKRFNKNYQLMENMYNTCMVLYYYCCAHKDEEYMSYIIPVVKYVKAESDKLLYNFTNIKIKSNEKDIY